MTNKLQIKKSKLLEIDEKFYYPIIEMSYILQRQCQFLVAG